MNAQAALHKLLVDISDALGWQEGAPCTCGHAKVAHCHDDEQGNEVYARCGYHDGDGERCGCQGYTAAAQ